MNKVDQALSCFKEGFNCSQAIVATYGPKLGVDRQTALKLSCAFGGGMCRMGQTCGTVTGALMVIGLKYGRNTVKDEQSKENTYRISQEFVKKFKLRHTSISCTELLGCDLGTPEGANLAKEKDFHNTLCPGFVKSAAEILEELMPDGTFVDD